MLLHSVGLRIQFGEPKLQKLLNQAECSLSSAELESSLPDENFKQACGNNLEIHQQHTAGYVHILSGNS